MKNNIIRNIIPNSISYNNNSNINQNQQQFYMYRKIKSPIIKNPKNELFRNASLDCNEMHRPRFNSNRKIAKSSYIKQRMENYSHLMNNMLSYKNIYNNFNFPKVPSFNKNISEIHQIINGKRHKKIKYLDNLFFNSMFSNEYLDDIYKIRKNNILFQHDKNKNKVKLFHRNNSSGQLMSLSKNYQNISKIDDSKDNDLSTNNTNILKVKNNKSINSFSNNPGKMKNNISNVSTTTNKSINTNKFPEIYSNSNVSLNEEYENKNKINFPLSPKISLPIISQGQLLNISSINSKRMDNESLESYLNNGSGSFITDLGVGKMKYKLNELMFENSRKNKRIDLFEKNILKLKIFQIYQKENLEKYINDNRFNIQDRIDHIIKMYKIYENIYDEYQLDLSRYINFLWLIMSDFEVELQVEIKKKRELDYEVEVLVDKLLTKQKVLERLIDLRNFLFRVKNKDKKIIKLDNEYLLNISKRNEFIDFLLELFDNEPNTIATKYLKKLIEIEELELILMKKKIKTNSTTRRNTSKSLILENNDDTLCPPPPGVKIFDDPDEFCKIIENLEDRNISLLKENENLRLANIQLRNELDKYIIIENDDIENTKINISIKEKIRKLKNLKEKNEILKKKRDYFNELYKYKDTNGSSNEKIKIVSHNLFTNLNYFYRINYNKLIQKYKYPFLLFLEKLITILNSMISSNDFKSLFEMKDCYTYIPPEILNEILKTKKEYFNEKNQYLIMNYTLKLIKLYEYIGEYFLRKNRLYRLNNEELYKKYNEEIQNERKIHNARAIRKLISEKREENAKKLIEKWQKRPIKSARKLDLDVKPFYLMRNLSQKNLKDKKKKKTNIGFNYKLLMNEI